MTLRICIGYDHREALAYHVLAHSILRRASRPVSIQPIMLSQFDKFWSRPRNPQQSTDFTFARFLTPWLCNFAGVSIFMDCDMLCLGDICELESIALADPYKDVFVVKHDYTPGTETKFLDQPQSTYPCKNWSSLMVFNGHRMPVQHLTPDYVNDAEPMALHQFDWASDIGELDPCWNHLVGEYKRNPDAKLIHYTRGGPYFLGYEYCEYAQHWWNELHDMMYVSRPSFQPISQR